MVSKFLLFVAALGLGINAHAQAVPTATSGIRLSAFAGFTGNYTGLQLAKNADVTAGFDVGFRPFAGFFPVLEARGMYPVDKGRTVSMDNLLGGIRLGRRKQRFSGYGDALFGRGRLNYAGGYPVPSGYFLVLSNTSNVLSFGGGVDYDWTSSLGLKADFQLQRYDTPVTTSGSLYSKVFTLGVIYRFPTGPVR